MRTLLLFPGLLLLLLLALAACAGRAPAPGHGASAAPPVECGGQAQLASRPAPELEAACERDPACGCAALGHALLMASDGAIEARSLEVLDGACRRGVVQSCRDSATIEELCVRGTARPSSACDVLARDGRVGTAEMQPR